LSFRISSIPIFFQNHSKRNQPSESEKEQFSTTSARTNEIESSLEALSLMQKPQVKRTKVLKPMKFQYEYDSDKKNLYGIYKDKKNGETNFVYFDGNAHRIKPEYNPKTLNRLIGFISADEICNNTYPAGSIAISSTLDKNLSTFGLLQCAGATFVDKSHNLQTMLHLCPGVEKDINDKIVEYILSASKPEDLEVTIVPGYYSETDISVDYLYNKINECAKGCKINFANFPDEKHETLVLRKGKVYAANRFQVKGNTNPIEKLICAV